MASKRYEKNTPGFHSRGHFIVLFSVGPFICVLHVQADLEKKQTLSKAKEERRKNKSFLSVYENKSSGAQIWSGPFGTGREKTREPSKIKESSFLKVEL